jgi:hypothetical protein
LFEPTFIQFGTQRILRLDYVDLSHAELLAAFESAGAVIRGEPERSLRILTILTCRFNEECAEALKRYSAANAPYVLASAVVATSFWRVVVRSLKIHGRPDLLLFDDEKGALEWLERS